MLAPFLALVMYNSVHRSVFSCGAFISFLNSQILRFGSLNCETSFV
jgi:hypothetical protein